MEQYIDKSAVVAEINSMLKSVEHTSHCDETSFNSGRWKALTSIKNFLDTLEVKEVDLETEERMKECPFRQVGCTMYEGKVLECRGACSWVVDYPKLKELKAKHKEES